MAIAKAVNHIGIAVSSIAAHRDFYEKALGAEYLGEEIVADQKVKVGFFKVGDVKLELLEPTDPESTIAKFIEKKGEGIHHMAFASTGLQENLDELSGKGVQLIDKAPRKGAEGLNIAFLHPKATGGVLLELCEDPGK